MQTSYNPIEKRIEIIIPVGKKVGASMTIHGGSLKQLYIGLVTDPYGTYLKVYDSTLDPSDPCYLPRAPAPPANYFMYPGNGTLYIMPVYELLGSPTIEKYFIAPSMQPNNLLAPNQTYTFTITPNPQDDITITLVESAGGGPAKAVKKKTTKKK